MNPTPSSQASSLSPSAAKPRLGFLIQAGLLAGPFMSMIDSSAVNVALPND